MRLSSTLECMNRMMSEGGGFLFWNNNKNFIIYQEMLQIVLVLNL